MQTHSVRSRNTDQQAAPAESRVAGVLGPDTLDEIDALLADADRLLATRYPGDPGTRQPVHTVYVNADLADAGLLARWAAGAREVLAVAAPDPAAAAGLGLSAVDAAVLGRVRAKLDAEPIEDLRLDFEDGYGNRHDAEEDTDAVRIGVLLPALLSDPAGPLLAGIRFKSLEAPTRRRGLRTLDLVVGGVLSAGPRCVALHYGTFDYSAACGVAASQQSLAHPVADHAKAVMQVAASGTGVRLSDGSTN